MAKQLYLLIDPRDPHTLYIGSTRNPKRRLQQHSVDSHKGTSKKDQWLREMRTAGIEPIVEIVGTIFDDSTALSEERKLIRYYTAKGFTVMNTVWRYPQQANRKAKTAHNGVVFFRSF